jgi:hypothetical protein
MHKQQNKEYNRLVHVQLNEWVEIWASYFVQIGVIKTAPKENLVQLISLLNYNDSLLHYKWNISWLNAQALFRESRFMHNTLYWLVARLSYVIQFNKHITDCVTFATFRKYVRRWVFCIMIVHVNKYPCVLYACTCMLLDTYVYIRTIIKTHSEECSPCIEHQN